ncbi:hypothetical protein GCM10007854_29680 [Algimonas porphyrae]|uniref:Uncharacterized protein n=1 Tax=Algimonas porphyrae TaxID=1128113 RepID=A0ABQ5V599_9PROT|nr:hypothetical protein GCM10007854_29680 [Algimonas porphyrae]
MRWSERRRSWLRRATGSVPPEPAPIEAGSGKIGRSEKRKKAVIANAIPIREKLTKKSRTRTNLAPRPPVEIAIELPIDRMISAYMRGLSGTNRASLASPAIDLAI